MTRLLEGRNPIIYGAAGGIGSGGIDVRMVVDGLAAATMLRRAPALDQVAEVAAFLASDRSGAMTGTIVNATCGLVPG